MSHLVLDNVTKRFGKTTVLDRIDLRVEAGETVVVFGPSGAGKTVLLRLLAGVYDPEEGDVRVGGESVVGAAPETRNVGMAFQNFALYPHLTAFDNIASPLRAHRHDEATVKRRVDEIAELLKIDHVLGHAPRALSNGQKQRTSLARALVRGPSLLLLDDPLRNVDAKLRYEMRIELPRLLARFGATVLYVTQDYKEAMALGQRVAVLIDGALQQADRPEAIYREPVSAEVARLFGDPTINLYPCTPTATADGASARLFGGDLPLPARFRDHAGRSCLLGLRPEHVAVDPAGEDGLLVELDAITPLNVRAVLLLKTPDGRELLASCPEEAAARFPRGHRQVRARIDTREALLFDAGSGARLAA